jgi:hypothetical protein
LAEVTIKKVPKAPIAFEQLKPEGLEPVGEASGEDKPKRKYTKRKQVEEVVAQPPPEIPIESIKVCVGVPFKVVARVRKCPVWLLTEDEIQEISDGIKPALDIYVAPYMEKYFPIVMGFMVIFGVLMDKIQLEKEYFENEKKEKAVASVVAEKLPTELDTK